MKDIDDNASANFSFFVTHTTDASTVIVDISDLELYCSLIDSEFSEIGAEGNVDSGERVVPYACVISDGGVDDGKCRHISMCDIIILALIINFGLT